ncbi:2-aminomuconate deaminase [Paenibacillus polymyxa E681]|uniref:RidA family protein n=1 Tax=Paenibacillus polymyxa TaxID=1406 RepID=UPI0001E3224E|nr:RidA family protein [Paenibacillus polymyxa]ADM72648.1 translation initiation inhibitor [Paenibacillus polymyxa E681]QNV59676.1 2-aminomuconate deaminase [Paenibacillus polymyxa E681]QNV64502.1 2-aminomuconate deaminase [Paenibacillus polymyxa E681]
MAKIKTYNHNLWDHGISQGYSVNDTLYISGQFSHNAAGEFIGVGDIETQTRQTLDNLDRVLSEFGITKANLAYVEAYLTNAQEHGGAFIELFKEYLGDQQPAGSLIGVSSLAFPEQWVEIRAVAHVD